MFYEVNITYFFEEEHKARALFNHAVGVFSQTVDVNPTSPNIERSFVELVDCHHDENPPKPCETIFRISRVKPQSEKKEGD